MLFNEKRREPRYTVKTNCVLYVENSDVEIECNIKDLSSVGIGLLNKIENIEGKKIRLALMEDDERFLEMFDSGYLVCEGFVVRNNENGVGISLRRSEALDKYLEDKEAMNYLNFMNFVDEE